MRNNRRLLIHAVCLGWVLLGSCSAPVERRGPHASWDIDVQPLDDRTPAQGEGRPAPPGPADATSGDPLDSLFDEYRATSEEAEDVTFLSRLDAQAVAGPEPATSIPIEDNARVASFVEYFQDSQNRWMERALRRSGRYRARMTEIFTEEGLPEDLVYLALIESGFNPYAYSRAGAMGIWQFMPATGRRYGLTINWWMDERRDLEKSTRAAARYLKDLHERFGDWYLAAAAYNAGEGKLQRAINKYESKDFWHISEQRYLKLETKNYVPKYLAALTIIKEPERYGFAPLEPDPPLHYETVPLPDATDLAVVAEGCGCTLAHIKQLNPQLNRGCTPPGHPGYEVKIPHGARERFLAHYAELAPSERLTFRRHRVRPGQTLSHIARIYGVSIASIQEMNHITNRHRIREGKSLVIPVPTRHVARGGSRKKGRSYGARQTSGALPDLSGQGRKRSVHVVRKGESLWEISRAYDLQLSELRTWNGLHNASRIYPGQKIVLWTEPPEALPSKNVTTASAGAAPTPARSGGRITHVVQEGDSLWEISGRYEVPLEDLKDWNRISSDTRIYPGQKLVVWRQEPRPSRADDTGAGEIWYTVRPGDTLWDIARRHGVTPRQLSTWNNLDAGRPIHPGLRIRICKQTGLNANAASLYADSVQD